MKFKKTVLLVVFILTLFGFYKVLTNVNMNPNIKVGEIIDSLDGVNVFYNGGVNHVLTRNTTVDGYNIGLKYQCVEFVKRYYLERYNHRMPETYGHAKDFFDDTIKQGDVNPKRDLKQYRNHNEKVPEVGDLLVYSPSLINPYGHVAIVSSVDLDTMKMEVVQQNPGPFSSSREIYSLEKNVSGWHILNDRVIGWLRKK